MQMYDTVSPLKTKLKFASNTDNYSKHHRDFAFLTVYELSLYLTKAARKRYRGGFDSPKQAPCRERDETNLHVVKRLWSPWGRIVKKQFNEFIFLLRKEYRGQGLGCALFWETTHCRVSTVHQLREK